MRRWLALLAVVTLSLHVACGGSSDSAPPPPTERRPNVVFVLTDDQDLPSLAFMPKVQALLVQQGMRLDEHFVSLSLCCPSRVTTLRGQYAHNTGVYGNNPPEGGFEGTYTKGLERSTLATWLQGAGYRTAFFGKYLNGYPEGAPAGYYPPGWDEWYAGTTGTPYRGFDYDMNENGTTVHYGSADEDYLTDVIARQAEDFIRRTVAADPNRPFLAYVAPFAPHAPATPAPRHAELFPDARAPRTASFNEADVSDKPAWVRALPPLTADQIAEMDKLYRHKLQALQAVDELVERLVNTLQATGQLAHTYIVFTSDNGYHQGQHRMDSGKMTAYEEDLRVPFVVRGPGIAAGSRATRVTANVDHAPTLAALAGATAPSFVDGRSLLPLWRGEAPAEWRQVLLLEHKPDKNDEAARRVSRFVATSGREPPDPMDLVAAGGDGMDITSFSGLRTAAGVTYIEYDTGEREYYDRAVDPAQLDNAYARTPTDQRARLADWLAALRSASGEALRQAEAHAP